MLSTLSITVIIMIVIMPYTIYRVLNVCVKRMRDCEFLPHVQSFYVH